MLGSIIEVFSYDILNNSSESGIVSMEGDVCGSTVNCVKRTCVRGMLA